jgi:NAD(P) transhydrogenase
VYTIPEIATVGLTEDELHIKKIDFECGRSSYRANPRGQIVGDLDGFVKLLFRADNQQLLGASIVGENASELIHIAMACLTFAGTIDFFIQSVFNYPSLADAYKYAAYDGLQALARRHTRRASLLSNTPPRTIITQP